MVVLFQQLSLRWECCLLAVINGNLVRFVFVLMPFNWCCVWLFTSALTFTFFTFALCFCFAVLRLAYVTNEL